MFPAGHAPVAELLRLKKKINGLIMHQNQLQKASKLLEEHAQDPPSCYALHTKCTLSEQYTLILDIEACIDKVYYSKLS